MSVKLNPYLNFDGKAREAMEFYRTVFGGELNVNTYADFQASQDPADQDRVMHSMLDCDGLTLMAADNPGSMEYRPPAGFSVSLSGDDESTLRGYWDGLSDGATVNMPLEQAPWGDTFGSLTDRFGIEWLVNIAGPGAQ